MFSSMQNCVIFCILKTIRNIFQYAKHTTERGNNGFGFNKKPFLFNGIPLFYKQKLFVEIHILGIRVLSSVCNY